MPNLRFITSNIERMRIDCNGIIDMWSNVYVGGNTQINGNCALSGIDFADGLYTNQYNPSITVNMSGLAYSGSNSGLLIEEAGSVTGYITSTSDRYGFQFKPPGGTIFQIYSSNNMVNLQK